MEKLVYTEQQKELLISGINMQIEVAKKQLEELYGLLSQMNASGVVESLKANSQSIPNIRSTEQKRSYSQRDGGKDYFSKIKEVLGLGEPMTSRDILNALYEYYPNEIDKDKDRKNIATISSILVEKSKDEAVLVRIKEEGAFARFVLPKQNIIGFPNAVNQ